MRWVSLVLALLATSCGSDERPSGGSAPSSTTVVDPTPTTSATTSATAVTSASAPVAPPASLPFVKWVAKHCYVDALGPSQYTETWRRYATEPDDEDALPVIESGVAPGGHDPEALERDWLAKPRSHVVDCRFQVKWRQCDGCTGQKSWEAMYVAYLPRDLFVAPSRVRTLLMLVPGGNGGRSRPFLSPLPGKTVFQRGSGGLRTKQLVDAWQKAHPDRPAPVVMSLDSWGHEYNNGPIEYLSYEIPHHVAQRYLDGVDPAVLTIGTEGISSGSRMILETLRKKPDAFHTAGLTCLSCGRLNPDKEAGIGEDGVMDLAKALAPRHREGEFDLRFAIGTRDGQLPCNERLYELFGRAGVVDPSAPLRYVDCPAGVTEDRDRCHTVRDGFATYAGEMHHYGLLIHSHAPQIEWQLDTLDRISRHRSNH